MSTVFKSDVGVSIPPKTDQLENELGLAGAFSDRAVWLQTGKTYQNTNDAFNIDMFVQLLCAV